MPTPDYVESNPYNEAKTKDVHLQEKQKQEFEKKQGTDNQNLIPGSETPPEHPIPAPEEKKSHD